MKNDAFEVKPFVFVHCCQNCVHAEKGKATGTYICEMDNSIRGGKWICDVEADSCDGNQVRWDLKEEE